SLKVFWGVILLTNRVFGAFHSTVAPSAVSSSAFETAARNSFTSSALSRVMGASLKPLMLSAQAGNAAANRVSKKHLFSIRVDSLVAGIIARRTGGVIT